MNEQQTRELNQLIRTETIAYIRKCLKTRGAKDGNWPGAPLGHFSVIGDDIVVLREMIADESVVVVERPRKTDPSRTATFICLP